MIDQHVTSLELSKQLYEAGIKIDSEFYWCIEATSKKLLDRIGVARWEPHITRGKSLEKTKKNREVFCEYLPAPLSSELGELLPVYAQFEEESLPFQIKIEKGIRDVDTDEWEVVYWRYSKTLVSEPEYQERGRVFTDTLPDAMAKMALYLKEKGLL